MYGFPMVFLRFSYGFPWLSHGLPTFFHGLTRRRPRDAPAPCAVSSFQLSPGQPPGDADISCLGSEVVRSESQRAGHVTHTHISYVYINIYV